MFQFNFMCIALFTKCTDTKRLYRIQGLNPHKCTFRAAVTREKLPGWYWEDTLSRACLWGESPSAPVWHWLNVTRMLQNIDTSGCLFLPQWLQYRRLAFYMADKVMGWFKPTGYLAAVGALYKPHTLVSSSGSLDWFPKPPDGESAEASAPLHAPVFLCCFVLQGSQPRSSKLFHSSHLQAKCKYLVAAKMQFLLISCGYLVFPLLLLKT